jgi:SAM-dependent methyltransferase
MKGPETEKSHERRLVTGFLDRYFEGNGIDVGYRGSSSDNEPVTPNAMGIDLDFPNYDGHIIPLPSESQDFVYSSHCLEHVDDDVKTVQEWFRIIKINGYLIITVPHKFLYEKKNSLPSNFNADHKRFYTPAILMQTIETALEPNSYRVRFLQDCDFGYDYSIAPEHHPCGEYQLELVLQKIVLPNWRLDYPYCPSTCE